MRSRVKLTQTAFSSSLLLKLNFSRVPKKTPTLHFCEKLSLYKPKKLNNLELQTNKTASDKSFKPFQSCPSSLTSNLTNFK